MRRGLCRHHLPRPWAAVARYPELIGWVYFNAPQPRWIPLATGHEDWTLPDPLLLLVTAPPEPRSLPCELLDASVPFVARRLCPPQEPAGA